MRGATTGSRASDLTGVRVQAFDRDCDRTWPSVNRGHLSCICGVEALDPPATVPAVAALVMAAVAAGAVVIHIRTQYSFLQGSSTETKANAKVKSFVKYGRCCLPENDPARSNAAEKTRHLQFKPKKKKERYVSSICLSARLLRL